VATQMLSGNGFQEVYNLSGGIKAWGRNVAVGDEKMGLELFAEADSFTQVLATAHALEGGLRNLYQAMMADVSNPAVQKVFGRLAEMETEHQRRLYALYQEVEAAPVSLEEFRRATAPAVAEGGFSIEEYRKRFIVDLSKPDSAISIAMTIEAQAMDLYQRAAGQQAPGPARDILLQIATEEKAHLRYLGQLMDEITTDI